MRDAVADFEASAYKRTQVRRNPNMERKTTLAWVALPKGKEPNAVSAETFANANASTNEKVSFMAAKLYISFLMKCLFIPFFYFA